MGPGRHITLRLILIILLKPVLEVLLVFSKLLPLITAPLELIE